MGDEELGEEELGDEELEYRFFILKTQDLIYPGVEFWVEFWSVSLEELAVGEIII